MIHYVMHLAHARIVYYNSYNNNIYKYININKYCIQYVLLCWIIKAFLMRIVLTVITHVITCVTETPVYISLQHITHVITCVINSLDIHDTIRIRNRCSLVLSVIAHTRDTRMGARDFACA